MRNGPRSGAPAFADAGRKENPLSENRQPGKREIKRHAIDEYSDVARPQKTRNDDEVKEPDETADDLAKGQGTEVSHHRKTVEQ
jgi:hypothetical protein